MCCWHSLWLRCVSSRAVCHSLVTQGELLISQERDVLASASGSWEDKQVARTTDATYAPEVLRKTLSATRVLLPSLHSPRRHTLTHSHKHRRADTPSHRAHPRALPGSSAHRSFLCGASPTCELGDFSADSDRGGENSHVM